MTDWIPIPWPEVDLCLCGRVPVVMLRDRLGAELSCKCGRAHVVWFTDDQRSAIDSVISRNRERM